MSETARAKLQEAGIEPTDEWIEMVPDGMSDEAIELAVSFIAGLDPDGQTPPMWGHAVSQGIAMTGGEVAPPAPEPRRVESTIVEPDPIPDTPPAPEPPRQEPPPEFNAEPGRVFRNPPEIRAWQRWTFEQIKREMHGGEPHELMRLARSGPDGYREARRQWVRETYADENWHAPHRPNHCESCSGTGVFAATGHGLTTAEGNELAYGETFAVVCQCHRGQERKHAGDGTLPTFNPAKMERA